LQPASPYAHLLIAPCESMLCVISLHTALIERISYNAHTARWLRLPRGIGCSQWLNRRAFLPTCGSLTHHTHTSVRALYLASRPAFPGYWHNTHAHATRPTTYHYYATTYIRATTGSGYARHAGILWLCTGLTACLSLLPAATTPTAHRRRRLTAFLFTRWTLPAFWMLFDSHLASAFAYHRAYKQTQHISTCCAPHQW